MSNEIEIDYVMNRLGFKVVYEGTYQHKELGEIDVDDIEDLVKIIHKMGYEKCQKDFHALLGLETRGNMVVTDLKSK